MKILITGGCGFIGSNLAQETLMRKHQLCIVDDLSRFGSESNFKWLSQIGKFQFHKIDIREFESIFSVIFKFKPDVIFHMAGQVAMTTSIKSPLLDFQINTLGTLNILESVKSIGINPFIIYSSTNKVYGDFEDLTFSETDTRYVCNEYPNGFDTSVPLNFQSPYGCSKGAADQYLLDYCRVYNLNTLVYRHSSMYGQRQFSTIDQGWIGWFVKNALDIKENNSNAKIDISGTGKQVRDVLNASDVVELYFKSIDDFNLLKGKAFNIGGGIQNSLSIIELLKLLEQILSIEININFLNARQSDQLVFIADNQKITELINWKPNLSYEEGIRNYIYWIKEQIMI